MKILVTGASSFLGGHLVELLAERGYTVICMVRKTSDTTLLDRLGLEKRVADLTDPSSLGEALDDVEAVVHLGADYTFHGKKSCTNA